MSEFDGLTREELVAIILELQEATAALKKENEELFVFVEQPEVPSDNNGAERALRPAVIARKVCGGTRSAKGSETKMTLMTLFGAWKVRGLDVMDACRKLLAGESVLFPNAA